MKRRHSSKLTALATGSLILGAVGAANASAELFQYSNLGSGSELRSRLLNSSSDSFSDNSYAANAEHGKEGGEGKCGEGKCGESKKDAKTEKPAAPTSDDSKGGEGKCGEGKCGGN